MKTRIFSLQSALMLAFVHLLLELWRSFLDFSYILPGYAGESVNMMAGIAAFYSALFAAWLLGLSSARSGSRGGIRVALLVGILFWFGLDLGTLLFYCPGGCEALVFDIFTWSAVLVGGTGLIGLAANLRRTQTGNAAADAPA